MALLLFRKSLDLFCVKRNNFDQNNGLTPLENIIFGYSKKRHFSRLEWLVCQIEHRQTVFLDLFSSKGNKLRIFQFLQNVWVDPFGKFQLFDHSQIDNFLV